MLRKILSISGKPGLYKLVSQGKNMLIVESLSTGKRGPVYSHDKVVSLGDIAMYTYHDEVPLTQILETVRVKNDGKPVDAKAIGDDAAVRAWFETILPDFDQERVYTTDIRKLISWYNALIAAGFEKFENEDAKEEEAAETAEAESVEKFKDNEIKEDEAATAAEAADKAATKSAKGASKK